tara:strand:- start:448 stop:1680 length:1233 start_codon:yes stop_codon:yes gene_type:complete
MLQLGFQTKQRGLDIGESLSYSAFKLVSHYGSLCSDSKSKGLRLEHQVDERLFNSMRYSGLSALFIFADDCVLLETLKTIILDIEVELQKYHSVDNARLPASDLDLFGAIDALEVVTYVGETNQITHKKNRLKRRLSEWSPPTYLIINSLNNFLASSSINLLEVGIVSKLKKEMSLYTHYRNRMVQANLRLVYSVANKFRYLALPYEDLVQEGNLGLIKAVERFDFSKGFRFSTYAHIVIGQSIHLAIDKQGSLVRLPFKALREKAAVEQVRQKLEQGLGRAPSIKDLEKHLPNDLEYKTAHIASLAVPNASSQQIYSVSENSELIEQCSPLEEDIKTSSLSHADVIERALERLNEREAYIIRMRFGIGLSKEFTLEEISQTVGLSRERVRQLAKHAIVKLSLSFGSDCS